MEFIFDRLLEDRGGLRSHGVFGSQQRRTVDRASRNIFGGLSQRAVGRKAVSPGGSAELFDVPHAHHPVVRVRNDVVRYLGADDVQTANRIFVGIS